MPGLSSFFRVTAAFEMPSSFASGSGSGVVSGLETLSRRLISWTIAVRSAVSVSTWPTKSTSGRPVVASTTHGAIGCVCSRRQLVEPGSRQCAANAAARETFASDVSGPALLRSTQYWKADAARSNGLRTNVNTKNSRKTRSGTALHESHGKSRLVRCSAKPFRFATFFM